MMVEKVSALIQDDAVRLDSERLDGLVRQLGNDGAENVVCRAIEELAVRLSQCERLWRSGDGKMLRKSARSMVAIAEQVGMTGLARVAGDVTNSIDAGDEVAVAATLFRMIRVGERSLTAIWDLQDLSV